MKYLIPIFSYFFYFSCLAQATQIVPMELSWNSIDGVDSYNVTISRLKDFKVSRSFKTKKNYLPIMVFPEVEYYWKITALDSKEQSLNQLEKYEFISKKGETVTAKIALSDTPRSSDAEAQSANQEAGSAGPTVAVLQGYGVKVATEIGVVNLEQSHSTYGNIDSTGLLFPSLALAAYTPVYAGIVSLELYFQQVLSDFDSDGGSITLSDAQFQWLKYGLQSKFYLYENGQWKIQPYLTIEENKTPYFRSITSTSMTIKSLTYFNSGIGVHVEKGSDVGWSYAGDINYSFPLADLTPLFSPCTVG